MREGWDPGLSRSAAHAAEAAWLGGKYVPTAVDIASDPAWFVENYDAQRNTVSFVRADRELLVREPFLDSRWNRAGLERCELSLDSLASRIGRLASPPTLHFIWHTSFCCSTLIAEALNSRGRNMSLREPQVLASMADAKRGFAQAKRLVPPRLHELAFRLLARSAIGGENVVVKPSNAANALIDDAARHCGGKALFLYSDLESFLISIEKGGVGLRKYARQLFGTIAGDSGEPLRWPVREIFQMSDLEIAALAWHMQIEQFQRSLRAFGPGRAASLDCEAFLAEPEATLTALDNFFELGLGEDHVARTVAGPLLRRHAKEPTQAFDAERRRAGNDVVRRALGPSLERVVEWSYRAFPNTPRGAPLAGALTALS